MGQKEALGTGHPCWACSQAARLISLEAPAAT